LLGKFCNFELTGVTPEAELTTAATVAVVAAVIVTRHNVTLRHIL